MATKMTKTTTNTEEKVVVAEKKEKTVKKFDAHELIECRSITAGSLFMEGGKSKLLYKWGGIGEIQEVEYQDLIYDVHSGNSFSKYPRFIILNDDFVNQNSQLIPIYDSLYSKNDLSEILRLPISEIKNIIVTLPSGARDTIKTLASTMVRSGQIDSINTVKGLDEIFETDMLHTLLDN